jgi:uncharacterized protein (UPF0548 family)
VRRVELTYPHVGATREMAAVPAGYRYVERRGLLGTGAATFEAAKAALRDWRMFRAAGLGVRTAAPVVAVGVEVAVGLGAGPARLWAPCRVVWVDDEPDRFAFGYGTLPGHPASGEEAFVVTREQDGRVWFEVRAFSRPATWYARLGGPATRAAQRWMAGRYLRAMREAS